METRDARLNIGVLLSLALAVAISWLGVLQLQIATSDLHSEGNQKRHHHVKPYAFPHGSRTLFPGYELIALYGTVDYPELGVLGEQSALASAARIHDLASQYQPLTTEHVMPTFEIIATVASATATENNDYSQEVDIAKLWPWVKTAREQGVYVVLDLQSGRNDFLSQAKLYQSLLEQPNVGLALDPEWRLKPDQIPLKQIGTVDIHEVNETIQWLSDLTAQKRLPQKLLVLHQFRIDMLPGRELLDTNHQNLAYIIQMDGSGGQAAKQDTWRTITTGAPANVQFGWKNFYREDHPVLNPGETMNISPQPRYVSYQ